jgi:uncharacterized membrane protein YsdA (DUF1294 family)
VKEILSYILVLNLTAYFVFAMDKKRAQMHRWRIPEVRLLSLAFIGGGIGAWRAMVDYHHKTNKTKFRFLVPFFICLQLGVIIYFFVPFTQQNSSDWFFLFLALFIHVILFYILKWLAKRGQSRR